MPATSVAVGACAALLLCAVPAAADPKVDMQFEGDARLHLELPLSTWRCVSAICSDGQEWRMPASGRASTRSATARSSVLWVRYAGSTKRSGCMPSTWPKKGGWML